MKEVARRLQAEVGDVDILVNNAGIVSGKRLLDVTDDVITKTIRVNLLAQMWVSKVFFITRASNMLYPTQGCSY